MRDRAQATSRWRVGAIVVAVVAAAGAAFVGLRGGGPGEPHEPLSQCGTVVHPVSKTGTRPMRVLLVGDSLLTQPSCVVAADLAHVGVETHLHAVPGTGLLTGAIDWQRRIATLLAAVHPDVVVALFSGNYPPPPVVRGGRPIAVDTAEFFQAWQDGARAFSEQVRSTGAQLFWVRPPPMAAGVPRAALLFAGYATLGDKLLDSGSVLGDAQGRWVNVKPECGTDNQELRANDSVHVTDAGAKVFGGRIAHDLAEALKLRLIPSPC